MWPDFGISEISACDSNGSKVKRTTTHWLSTQTTIWPPWCPASLTKIKPKPHTQRLWLNWSRVRYEHLHVLQVPCVTECTARAEDQHLLQTCSIRKMPHRQWIHFPASHCVPPVWKGPCWGSYCSSSRLVYVVCGGWRWIRRQFPKSVRSCMMLQETLRKWQAVQAPITQTYVVTPL